MLTLILVAVALPGYTGEDLSRSERKRVTAFLGDYQGAFDTAVTATPLDDMNINPCRDCDVHGAPLKDIFLRLALVDDQLQLSFHRDRTAPAFDLLGKYCHSDIGALESAESVDGHGKDSGDNYAVTTLTFVFDAGRCPRNITENKTPQLTLSLLQNRTRGMQFAKVEIDKDWRRVVTLSAENREGERVEVKSNPNDYGKSKRHTRSYLYQDELGDFSRARSNTTETRYFSIPLVLNGYVGANLTWWPHKILDVEVDTESVLTRHTAVFVPVSVSDTRSD